MSTTPIDLAGLRALAESAAHPDRNGDFESPDFFREEWALYRAMTPRTVLALLDRLAAAEAVVEAARRDMQAKAYEPGMPERVNAHLSLAYRLSAYDRACGASRASIAGQEGEK